VVVIQKNLAYYAQIGDAFLFLLRKKNLRRLTKNPPTLANSMLANAEVTQDSEEGEAKQSSPEESRIWIAPEPILLNPDDLLLLCSDGLTKEVNEHAILPILNQHGLTLQGKADLLTNLVNFKEKESQISIALIQQEQIDSTVAQVHISKENVPSQDRQTEVTSKTEHGSWLTFVAFLIFAAIVVFLHLENRKYWVEDSIQANTKADSLQQSLMEMIERYDQLTQADANEIEATRSYLFDPYDSDNYRVYGLFRDRNKVYTVKEIAAKFNILPPTAIKSNDVLGERWFIIPVKGVHFMREGENLTQIAQLYYENAEDSTLIQDFNPIIESNMNLFIPFGR